MKRFEGFMFGANLGGWLSQYDEDTREHFDSFITESDIYGDSSICVKKRMSGLFQVNDAIFVEYRSCCSHIKCKGGLGEYKVKFSQGIQVHIKLIGMLGAVSGQPGQYDMDLFFFIKLEFAKLIVV